MRETLQSRSRTRPTKNLLATVAPLPGVLKTTLTENAFQEKYRDVKSRYPSGVSGFFWSLDQETLHVSRKTRAMCDWPHEFDEWETESKERSRRGMEKGNLIKNLHCGYRQNGLELRNCFWNYIFEHKIYNTHNRWFEGEIGGKGKLEEKGNCGGRIYRPVYQYD